VKISDVFGDTYRPSRYGRVFERERVAGVDRLRIGFDDAPDGCVLALASVLAGPFQLLYVLHTTRTGAALGRYESPELSLEDVDAFFRAFGRFVSEDARHDLWVRSHNERATIVLDRHNIIYAYGPIDLFEATLLRDGAGAGTAPDADRVHAHHYHAEWDEAERAVLKYGDWRVTPLQPSDVQFEGRKPEA
jgi:hypothetical protein